MSLKSGEEEKMENPFSDTSEEPLRRINNNDDIYKRIDKIIPLNPERKEEKFIPLNPERKEEKFIPLNPETKKGLTPGMLMSLYFSDGTLSQSQKEEVAKLLLKLLNGEDLDKIERNFLEYLMQVYKGENNLENFEKK